MDNESNRPECKKQKEKDNYHGFCLPIGIALGVAVGLSTGNIALWLGAGICIGASLDSDRKKK